MEKRTTDHPLTMMVREHHQLRRQEFEQTPGNSGGEESPECCNPWGHKKPDMIQ